MLKIKVVETELSSIENDLSLAIENIEVNVKNKVIDIQYIDTVERKYYFLVKYETKDHDTLLESS